MSEKKQDNKIKTFEDIDRQAKILSIEKSLMIDEHLTSSDPDKIIKASTYLNNIEGKDKKNGNIKAYLFSPEQEFYTGMGYKASTKSISFDLMRSMANTPNISSIITTRVNQISNFTNFTTDQQREGWTIRKKIFRFDEHEDPNDKEKRRIDVIAEFLENGGINNKWDLNDDFQDFVKKVTQDSLTFDQATFECERKRNFELVAYAAVDASTMRLLETVDPKHRNELNLPDIKGYLPRYCQVWNSRIANNPITKEPIVYYPWELSFGVRNKTTNIRNNGYGTAELEILTEIVTWLLWGMQYNGNFFKQGSNPKGFFTIDGATNQNMLNEFRSAWRNTMSGVQNAHKVPVFEGGKVAWEDMQKTNRDMEFTEWNQFLILMACSIYKIDPTEVGFRFKTQGEVFGQDGQKERLEHSINKGLKPILVLLQKQINKYIVSELDSNYEFIWTGIDLEDETQILENDAKKAVNGFVSMEDMFEKHSQRKFDPKKDTILNTVYQQAQQAKQFGGAESNAAVDEMTGEPEEGTPNPFEEFGKSIESNPIMQESFKVIDKMFKS